jgi:glycosyltransferase involved in cell wall biosynthesis
VLFTSGATRSLYVARYPEIQERSYVVYNGVDLDDFGGDVAVRERPTVAHVGTLHEYQRKQVELFLHGFARALMTGRVPSETEVVFAGTIGLKLRVRLQTIVRSLGITGSVRLADFLPHTDAVYWMRASRLLLLFAGDNYYIRLSKISEYIAAGRPLLALAAEKSETAQEVRAYGGRVISDASEVSIEAELARVFAGSAPQCCASHRFDHPHPLNRRTEAKYLADILSRNVADVNASTVSK